ncbi:amidohydrolase family protein [Pseudarthrobacter equi]|uniref:N-acetylglucosamine-6-phosphate deacetylase n=1 Tax=Pseudarthrobacter equi TaxID=728066 RepID=UPI0028D12848|nr:amidohydrolase family protein [Pseudarthrobacter equi]
MRRDLILRGHVVTGSMDIDDGLIAVSGDRISYAGPATEFPGNPGRAETAGHLLMPGLVDLHCHGAFGSDFSEGTLEGSRAAARYLHSKGTTTLLASLVTAPREDLIRNLQTLQTLTHEGIVAGSHLEGPFLAAGHCGAHDPALLLEPDPALMASLLTAAGPSLSTMTLAAELPGAADLVNMLTQQGATPSLGHTAAAHAVATEFLAHAATGLGLSTSSAGRRPTVTHLFNAMPGLHHRSPGPVAASLSAAQAGKAVLELIADGVHLAPETVKLVFDSVGADNIALVTDSMAATGLQDGHYQLGSLAVTVQQGIARLDSNGAIAGGTATLLDVVRTAVAAGVPLQHAVMSATAVPAEVLGRSANIGDLRPGMSADIVVVDHDLNLSAVFRQGARIASLERKAV